MSDEENRDDAGEPRPVESSRLGREIKIGVTVIVVLLIAFGAAVAVRLKGLRGETNLASAAGTESGSEKTKDQSTTDSLLKETKAKYFGNPSPTVVAARAATIEPPKTSLGDTDQWKLASERGPSPSLQGGSSAPSVRPSFMPTPPPAHAGPTEPQASAAPPAKAEQPRLFEAQVAKPLPQANPLRGQDSRYAVARGDDAVRPASGQGPALMGGSSPAAAANSQSPASASLLPPSRDNTPAEPPAAAQLPPSSPAASSDSVGVASAAAPMPVAQATSDEYRREPASPQSSSSVPRRAAPSYGPPARRDDGKYEVQPNDTYWTISEKLYGTSAYFKALAHHNSSMGTDDDRLKPGELILAPPVAELEKAYPGLCPRASRREAQQSQSQNRVSTVGLRGAARGGRTYTVVEGDTLFNIARYELGKAARWAEIYELNRDVLGKDFNYLTPGTQLTLPEGPKTDVIAQPPSNSYRR